jgi:hypothetical protein
MKTLLALLLLASLASPLAFGQKFQDVSKKGSPLSLSIGFYPEDPQPAVFAHNNSSKGVLALVAVVNFKDSTGQSFPLTTNQDYAFKIGVLKSHDERGIAPVDIPNIKTISNEGGSIVQEVEDRPDPLKIKQAVGNGAVLFVQFEDGTTWGDAGAGKQLLDSRPKRLAFLKRLVELYYQSGQDAFDAALNDPTLDRSERSVAGCLKGDAEYEKMSTIELAKKRLADALEWRALGIF